MTCEVCKKYEIGLAWVSSPSGSYVICPDCAQPLQQGLNDLFSRLARGDTTGSLLNELLATAMDVTGSDMGNVQLVDERGILRIRAQVVFQREFLDFFSGVHENVAACGVAAADRRTVVVTDVEASAIFAGTDALAILRNAGVRAVQSTPMFSTGGALLGIVSTHFRSIHAFTGRVLDSVSHLAARAAVLVGNFALVLS